MISRCNSLLLKSLKLLCPMTGPSPKAVDSSPQIRIPSSSHGKGTSDIDINAHSHAHLNFNNNCPDTAEYRTICECTPDLKTAVEGHIPYVSGHLLANHLISSDQEVELSNTMLTECGKAALLVQFVRNKVEQNSENYQSFVNILKKDKMTFQDILKCLNDTSLPYLHLNLET